MHDLSLPQDREGLPSGFTLHWRKSHFVLSAQGEETTLLLTAYAGAIFNFPNVCTHRAHQCHNQRTIGDAQ